MQLLHYVAPGAGVPNDTNAKRRKPRLHVQGRAMCASVRCISSALTFPSANASASSERGPTAIVADLSGTLFIEHQA
jgi:hypothetical protein